MGQREDIENALLLLLLFLYFIFKPLHIVNPKDIFCLPIQFDA